MLFSVLWEGFLLGLSMGAYCLATCAPIYGPVIIQKEQNWLSGFKTVMMISLGRFIAYAVFGLAFGEIGSLAPAGYLPKNIAAVVSYLTLSLYLIFTAVVQIGRERKPCAVKNISKFSGRPFLIGLLTGISICPAFLLAIVRSFDIGGAWAGLMLFLGFFISTTLYLLPFSALSFLSRRRMFRIIGIAASIAAAGWFLWLSGSRGWYLMTVR